MGKILKVFGSHDKNTLDQLQQVADRAVYTVLCADGHFGFDFPVGGVAAYRNEVSLMGVGYDIACGNCAIKTDMKLSDFGKSSAKSRMMLERVADDITKNISFGVGRSNLAKDAPTDHELFKRDVWQTVLRTRAGHGEARRLLSKARDQIGTVGAGNHYVDVFFDYLDQSIWVGVHFGSRGFGHGICSGFLAEAQGLVWGDRPKDKDVLLSLLSSAGQDYWAMLQLAGDYAYLVVSM